MKIDLPLATFLVGIAALIAALVSSGINFLTACLIRIFVETLGGGIKTREDVSKHLRRVHCITDAAKRKIGDYSNKTQKNNDPQQFGFLFSFIN